MQAVIELKDLSPVSQRTLRAAVRGEGLSLWLGAYVVTQWHQDEVGMRYSPIDVRNLQRRDLLSDAYPVRVTDAGIELMNCGRVSREVESAE